MQKTETVPDGPFCVCTEVVPMCEEDIKTVWNWSGGSGWLVVSSSYCECGTKDAMSVTKPNGFGRPVK